MATEVEETELAGELFRAYLAKEISFGKVAELLGLSRFELQKRCQRRGIPLDLGPATLEEAKREVAVALAAMNDDRPSTC